MSYELGPLSAPPPRADVSTVDIDWSMVDLSPGACVNRGMLHIQRAYPAALWKISLSNLSAIDEYDCILGQLYGHVLLSPEYQRWTPERLIAHAFMANGSTYEAIRANADDLDALWRTAFSAWASML